MALYRPHRDGNQPPRNEKLTKIDGGYVLTADLTDGQVVALLPTDDSALLSADGLSTDGAILVQRRDKDGNVVATLKLDQ